MKRKITDEIKDIFSQSINWAKLEVEYVKLTAAEKIIILLSTLILGAVFMLFLLPVIIMLLFALADLFKLMMPSYLAYLSVGGVVLILLLFVWIFRKQIIINPVARFVSRLILEKNHQSH